MNAGDAHVGNNEVHVDAGCQDIMFGCAGEETERRHAFPRLLATRLKKKLMNVRKNGDLWWLGPVRRREMGAVLLILLELKQLDIVVCSGDCFVAQDSPDCLK